MVGGGAGVGAEAADGVDDEGGGVFVLLPGADVVAELEVFAGFGFFEGGAEVGDLAVGGDDGAVEAFGEGEGDAGEVAEVGGGIEVEGVDALFAHEGLGAGGAGLVFVDGDGGGCAGHRSEAGEFLVERGAADALDHGYAPPVVGLSGRIDAGGSGLRPPWR